ncbi:uncharacterized protein TNCV_2420591 [Trichonephila clavipes]|uniref:Uncharacterized protein n=1 Tax=Trichonephila clavipes TaxID=2585209 RepID=A0A8X6RGL8_TRICX|nr:uncharacterized protein TNCV_2420591 [Trichonephila clavipes]
MAKHKSGPTELTTDDEDMIMYDVQAEELEPNPEDKYTIIDCFVNNPSKYMRSLTPTRFRKTTTLHPTKPGTASQGTFRSRYGMEESAQVPVPNMSREKIPENSKLAYMAANDAKLVAKVAKLVVKIAKLAAEYDANMTLPPRFRQVHNELPL